MSTETESPSSESSGTGNGFAEDAQAKAQDAMSQVQDQAQAAVQQAQATLGETQDRVREQVGQRSAQLGQQISAQASDLREVSDALREKDQDGPAQLADRVAGYAEQAGSYLESTDVDTIIGDAESYGRQHPGTVAAGALALGFAAARFLKASSARRYATQGQSSSRGGTAQGTGDPRVDDIEPAVIVDSDVVPGTHPIEPVPEGKPDVVAGTMNEGI